MQKNKFLLLLLFLAFELVPKSDEKKHSLPTRVGNVALTVGLGVGLIFLGWRRYGFIKPERFTQKFSVGKDEFCNRVQRYKQQRVVESHRYNHKLKRQYEMLTYEAQLVAYTINEARMVQQNLSSQMEAVSAGAANLNQDSAKLSQALKNSTNSVVDATREECFDRARKSFARELQTNPKFAKLFGL